MKPKNVEAIYPLAPTQQGILFHNFYDPGSDIYFEIITWTIHGEVNLPAFRKAWQGVVDRHPILRTFFVWEELNEPLQVVRKSVRLPLTYEDWRGLTPEVQQQQIDEFFARERARGFDLSTAPLMRVALIQLEDDIYRFVWSYHHVLIDGWSLFLIFNDVFNFYETLAQGHELKVEPGRPFRDYIVWLRQQDLTEAEMFWRRTLKGFVEPTSFGVDNGKSSETHTYAEEQLYLSAATSDALQAFARRHQLTLNTLFQAAWAILLNRYSGERDVVFGVAVSGRPPQLPEVESIVGMLINTLPARIEVTPGATLLPWLRQIQEQQVTMRKYEYTPLRQIQRWSDVPNRMQLFESIMVFENHPLDSSLGTRNGKAELRDIVHYHTAPGYPLNVVIEPGKELLVKIMYDVGRFQAAPVQQMLRHFQQLLENVVANAGATLNELEMITPEERKKLLNECHGLRTAYPRESCIHELFEAEVERAPEAIAVTFGEQQLTYRELNERANQLAHHLRRLGVGPEVLVGLCLERSLKSIVGLLGILKASAAYVPLDPNYPAERLAFMLEDSAAPVLLTEDKLVNTLPANWSTVVCLDTDWDEIAASSTENPVNQNSADSLAYLIYTSGSTGQPKGVLNLQRGAINRFRWMWEQYPFAAGEVCCQKTSLNFVDSVWEIFGPLLQGIPSVVIPDEIVKDTVRLVDVLSRNDVTRITVVPSLLRMILNLDIDLQAQLSKLKYWTTSGEVLTQELLEAFQSKLPEAVLLNLYGSSEVAADVTSWEMDHQHGRATVAIGRPIANTQVYLLNSDLQPVPIGVAGELYAGGAGLARGYHKRPDLTAESFVPSPFGPAGARLYRSGDLARYRPDGTIEYLGRTDHQIKLRGFRIELGEIESVLRDHEAVKDAVVALREDAPDDKRLVAYLITTDDVVNDLRSYMKAKLPDYMVPSVFVLLDALPLTANGKVDRRALPAPDGTRPGLAQQFVAPRTEIEQLLTGIWSQALGMDQVGIDDDFFALGGDSIRSVQVLAKAQERGLALSLQDLFKYQTIRELAHVAITSHDGAERHEATRPFELIGQDDRLKLPPDLEDAYPLTMLQAGMIFHSELNPGSGVFHDIFSYHVRAPYNADAMHTALESIVQRHAALRTSFVLHSFGEPLQLVVPTVEVPLHVSDLRDLSPEDQEKFLREHLETERNRGFDLTRAPLLKIELHRRTDESFQFTVGFHHAILDGWSLASMLAELFQSYVSLLEQDGPPAAVKPPASSYRDYVAMERRALRSEEFRRYWRDKLDGGNDSGLKQWLFLDGEDDTDAPVHRVPIELAPELATRLRELARSVSVPIKSVLLAAHLKVMSVLSGDSDVITGLVSHGRPEKGDGEQLLGMFLNTIPFRQRLQPGSWKDLVKQTFENEWEALPYRRYPLAQMQREQGGRELFAAAFNFAHFHVTRALHENSRIEVLDSFGFERTNLPLLVNFSLGVNSSEIFSSVDADAKRLSKQRATAIADYYLRALTAMATEPETNHASTLLLSDEERQKVLVEWNQTAAEYSSEMTLTQLFEAQVERTPEAVALIFDDERIAYDELNRRANQLAHHLVKLGVGPEQLVGVCMERSIEMVMAMLGVLKTGAAYVPLDPAYPSERLAFVLADADVRLIITQPSLLDTLPATFEPIDTNYFAEPVRLCVNKSISRRDGKSAKDTRIDPGNLAYMIYTSGSTGQPKGVLNLHRGAINRFRWMWERYPFAAGEVSCQKTSLNFVDSIWEIFGPLLQGVPSVIIQDELVKDPVKLVEVLSQQEVTRITVVPSLLRMILDIEMDLQAKLPKLKYWTTSGEALSSELVEVFRQRLPDAVLLNLYGSSEVAADVTYCEVLRENGATAVPIGRPIANTQIYLLDSDLQPVPVGVAGELYVGGAGLSRGYHNRPELTAQRFVPSPFGTVVGARLYRTGDLARYRPDGAIEYLGRTDHQVKLRGFRIELGEVEAVLNDHEAVKQAVAVVREDSPGDPRLVAYVMTSEHDGEIINRLRRYMKDRVPDYMVPAVFVQLQKFPLTSSGKIDRQALPAPDQSRPMLEQEFVAPRNEIEETIAQIWREVLNVERIGVHDNFFDIGGNSLVAMQILANVRNSYDDVYLPLYSLFETPTIAGLAKQIELAGQDAQELQEII